MSGQPHTTWVCQPLGIEHQHVRPVRQPLQRRQHHRPFPESQQPRHVGEQNKHLRCNCVKGRKVRIGEQHCSRPRPFPLHADVYTRDDLWLVIEGLHEHTVTQPALDFPGLSR